MLKYGYFADSSIMVTILLQITSRGTLQQCCIISSDALNFMSENGNNNIGVLCRQSIMCTYAMGTLPTVLLWLLYGYKSQVEVH